MNRPPPDGPGRKLSAAECRARFTAARRAVLATVSPAGVPHLVPITFALLPGDVIVTAVDGKPKRTTRLSRLADIQAHPAVGFLVDEYDDQDWSRLWWVRAEGDARLLPPGGGAAPRPERAEALAALIERYPQYRGMPPEGTVIRTEVTGWRGWSWR